VTFQHISREENQLADALATLSSMFEISQEGELPMIKMKSHEQPTYYSFMKNQMASHGTLISRDTSKTKNIQRNPMKMTKEC